MQTNAQSGRRLASSLIAATALASCHTAARAQTTFNPILGTRFADHITPDGRVVVGRTGDFQSFLHATRWTREGGVEDWGGPAYDKPVYTDGSGSFLAAATPVGGNWYRTYRWSEPNTTTKWGPILRGISADGRTAAFTENDIGEGSHRSYVEYQGGGGIYIPYFPDQHDGTFYNDIRDMSDDGNTVVGDSWGRAFVWHPNIGGYLEEVAPGIGDMATAVSRSGAGIAGIQYVTYYSRKVWARQSDGQVIVMPSIDGHETVGPTAISDNDQIVYVNSTGEFENYSAFLWSPGEDPLPLDAVLGNSLPQGWHIRSVSDATADGMTIVGQCIDPFGSYHGFIATIPAPATAALGALGALAFSPRRRAVAPAAQRR